MTTKLKRHQIHYIMHAIRFYKKPGFITESCVVLDIGNGFVMDDYKMVKNLNDK